MGEAPHTEPETGEEGDRPQLGAFVNFVWLAVVSPVPCLGPGAGLAFSYCPCAPGLLCLCRAGEGRLGRRQMHSFLPCVLVLLCCCDKVAEMG